MTFLSKPIAAMLFSIVSLVLISSPSAAYAQDSATELCPAAPKLMPYLEGASNALTVMVLGCDGDTLKVQLAPSSSNENIMISLPKSLVADPYDFYGLAQIYSTTRPIELSYNLAEEIDLEKPIQNKSWIGISGRYKAMMFYAPTADYSISEDDISLNWNAGEAIEVSIFYGEIANNHNTLLAEGTNVSDLRFFHLWGIFQAFSKAIVATLVFLTGLVGGNWGLGILFLCLIVKLFMIPLGLLVAKYEREVALYQTKLAPILLDIKQNYKGEKAHNKLMAAYKDLNISPFYTLKPLVGSLVQVPILISIFNALGEMPQLQNASFLWIESLAYPDTIFLLPWTTPLMGSGLNLLPILMTLITIISTIVFRNIHAPKDEEKKQKRNLYLMAFGFFILFFPFPAGMVLYWVTANVLQFVQQQVMLKYSE